jgi:putative cardiolipin synthase
LLANSRDAFGARARLAEVAQRTLDVQYYIWEDDMTGTLLFQALHAAADRGVRVRLLLDDNTTQGLHPVLAALDSHPNIEVRLFNPFVIRRPRIGYLTDFARANRRMQNKSFTVDNQVTIIGGRNIGDEHFGATAEGSLFVDLDVLAVGPVVPEVSRD